MSPALRLWPAPLVLGGLLTACTLRMQPAERARPNVPLSPAAPLPAPTPGKPRPVAVPPPLAYRQGYLDTLMVGERIIRLYPASRAVYEQLPVQEWLVNEAASEGDELDPEAEERRRLRTARTAQRTGRALLLRCQNGKQVRLLNNPTEDYDTSVLYQYVATLPGIHHWLIAVHLYEGGYYLLIDQKTGRQTMVWSPPSVSPDGHYFICGSSDVLARYEPSGLQVWSMKTGRPQLLWERQTTWGVSQPRWLNGYTVLFEQDYLHKNDVDTRVVRLTLPN